MSRLREKIASGSLLTLVGRVATLALGVLINGLLTRLLSPSDVATYFVCLSMITVIAGLAPAGLNQASVKLLSIGEDESKNPATFWLISFATTVSMANCIVILIGFRFGATRWLIDSFEQINAILTVWNLVFLWAVIRCMQDLLAEFYRGLYKILNTVLFGGLLVSILTSIGLGFLYLNADAEKVDLDTLLAIIVFSHALCVFLSIAVMINFMVRNGLFKVDKENIVRSKSWLILSFPMWISTCMFLLLSQSDIWLVAIYDSDLNTALYGAGLKLAVILQLPLSIVNAISPPLIAKYFYEKREAHIERELRIITTISFAIAATGFIIFLFIGREILGLIYGVFYRDAYVFLVILGMGQLFNVGSGSCSIALNMSGHQKVVMYSSMVIIPIVIGLAFWLASIYGAIGVALAITTGQISFNFWMAYQSSRRTNIKTHTYLWPPQRQAPHLN